VRSWSSFSRWKGSGPLRRSEVQVGHHYLTRDVTIRGVLGNHRTRGVVEVLVDNGRRYYVQWLMRDGNVRADDRLPKWLLARDLLAEVPNG
jgi:hypothetical protein